MIRGSSQGATMSRYESGADSHAKFTTTNWEIIVTAQSGTHGDIPAGAMVSGSPAFDHKEWLRAVGIFNKLPELEKAVRSIMATQKGASASETDKS